MDWATHICSRNAQGAVPQGITGVASHGPIHAAIDNFDQIEETVDGKHMTHAMATVAYKCGYNSADDDRIQRVHEKSLKNLDTFDVNENVIQR